MLEMFVALTLTVGTPSGHLDDDAWEIYRVMPKEQRVKVKASLMRRGVCEDDETWSDDCFHGFMNVMRHRVLGTNSPAIDDNFARWQKRRSMGEIP